MTSFLNPKKISTSLPIKTKHCKFYNTLLSTPQNFQYQISNKSHALKQNKKNNWQTFEASFEYLLRRKVKKRRKKNLFRANLSTNNAEMYTRWSRPARTRTPARAMSVGKILLATTWHWITSHVLQVLPMYTDIRKINVASNVENRRGHALKEYFCSYTTQHQKEKERKEKKDFFQFRTIWHVILVLL